MPNPPRYRLIRGATWGLYLFLALGFVGLIVAAVVRGVMAERSAAAVAEGPSDPQSCANELARIYRDVHLELDRQRVVAADESAANAGWAALRTRLTGLGARCHLAKSDASPLGRAYVKVVALQRLAESAAVQYRHEVGATDEDAQRLLREAGVVAE